MSDRKPVPGKFVWFELASGDARKAQAFYAEVLGWKAVQFPFGGASYEMIFAGETPDTMVGGYAPPLGAGAGGKWIASVSVEDVDAAAFAAKANGGTVIVPPHDMPEVGRGATIADPDGAEIALFRDSRGDPPDVASSPPGRFIWNELHTPDPKRALAFYEKVVGFASRTVDSPAGAYHILSKGGVDRGGVTSHLPAGVVPHWLPIVHVDDVDLAIARARKLGATIPREPADMPGIGRFGLLVDPTGAKLALMKPVPRATKAALNNPDPTRNFEEFPCSSSTCI